MADRFPFVLSQGQRRRMGLAACFVRPHRLLVLDEPEQNLDRRGRAWLADTIRAERRAGVSVLMACHDQDWSTRSRIPRSSSDSTGTTTTVTIVTTTATTATPVTATTAATGDR